MSKTKFPAQYIHQSGSRRVIIEFTSRNEGTIVENKENLYGMEVGYHSTVFTSCLNISTFKPYKVIVNLRELFGK